MTSTLKSVCLIGVLLVAVGASGAVASPLLSADEMSALRGGCYGWYCKAFTCGSGPESCTHNGTVPGSCSPSQPDIACDNQKRQVSTEEQCTWRKPTTSPCTKGDLKYCGRVWDCHCDWDLLLKMYICKSTLVSHIAYFECIGS